MLPNYFEAFQDELVKIAMTTEEHRSYVREATPAGPRSKLQGSVKEMRSTLADRLRGERGSAPKAFKKPIQLTEEHVPSSLPKTQNLKQQASPVGAGLPTRHGTAAGPPPSAAHVPAASSATKVMPKPSVASSLVHSPALPHAGVPGGMGNAMRRGAAMFKAHGGKAAIGLGVGALALHDLKAHRHEASR